MNALPPTSSSCDLDSDIGAPERPRADHAHVALGVNVQRAWSPLHHGNLAAADGNPARIVQGDRARDGEERRIDHKEATRVAGGRVHARAVRDAGRREAAQTRAGIAGEHELVTDELHDLEYRGSRESRIARGFGEIDFDS